MAITPERKVKLKVTAILDEYKAYYFYPNTGGYGASGVPDIVCCFMGQFIAIECKAGKNTCSALQRQNIERIEISSGIALVVNEENIDDVRDVLQNIFESRIENDRP